MKSVFDGWTRKIKGCLDDGEGGYCALGWLRYGRARDKNVWLDDESFDALARVGKWIHNNLDYQEEFVSAVVWANNECKLDIEGFKMVDLLTQGYVPEVNEVAEELINEIPEMVVSPT